MTDPCVVCAQNTETKPKPGVFPCLGCKQMFCTQHVAFHRQELANKLDLVIGDRNELHDILDHHQDIPDISGQMNLIDEWVKKTVAQVYQVADNVRQQIICLAEEQKMNLKDQFAEFSKQLDIFRENENFYEKDIENLKEKCFCLKRFLDPVDIHVIVTDISSSLAQAVTLQQREEKPVKISSAVGSLSFVENLVKHRKPGERIQIPHSGSLYMGNEIALLRSDDNFTVIDLKTYSLQSIRLENSRHLIVCWSTYLNGLMCANPQIDSKIEFFKIREQTLEKVNEFDSVIEKISCMVCYTDRMMLVCRGTECNNRVEEWSLQEFENRQTQFTGWDHGRRTIRTVGSNKLQNQQKQPTNPIHCWRSPLTCASHEVVADISFDDERIVLLITDALIPAKNRVEFRTRNMYVIGHLMLSGYNQNFSSVLCRLTDGWLLGFREQIDKPWDFTLIDNNLKQHEQKILSTYGIIKIEVVKNSTNESVLAIYRERGCVDTLTHDRSQLVLDLYKI